MRMFNSLLFGVILHTIQLVLWLWPSVQGDVVPEHVPTGKVQVCSNKKVQCTFWLRESGFIQSLPTPAYLLITVKDKQEDKLPPKGKIILNLSQIKGGHLKRQAVVDLKPVKIGAAWFAKFADPFKVTKEELDDGEYELTAQILIQGTTSLKTPVWHVTVIPFDFNKQNYQTKVTEKYTVECWTDGKIAKPDMGIDVFLRLEAKEDKGQGAPKAKVFLILTQLGGGKLQRRAVVEPVFVRKNGRWVVRMTDVFTSAVTIKTPNGVRLEVGDYVIEARIWLDNKPACRFDGMLLTVVH